MAGFSFSAVDLLLLVCVLWRTWVQVFTDAHQGDEIIFKQKHLFLFSNLMKWG